MTIFFKPTGTLDLSPGATELSENDLQRCKNLRMNENGKLVTRDGSYKLNSDVLVGTMDFIIEKNGVRYIFGEQYIYRNESQISEGVQCETPVFDPDGGEYAAAQTVTITCATEGSKIYYTLDGNTPNEGSDLYTEPITVELYTTLKAVGIKEGFLNSAIAEAYYSSTSVGTFVTETAVDNLYTDGQAGVYNQLITEGAP